MSDADRARAIASNHGDGDTEPPGAEARREEAGVRGSAGGSVRDQFADLREPRLERTRRHELLDIITIVLCALILLRRESTARVGINAKRLKAGGSDAYLAAVLRA